MDKIKIGQLIKERRSDNKQSAFADFLREKGVEIDISRLSKVENGKESSDDLYSRICEALTITLPDVDKRLYVAFSQGFWSAPIVWINESLGTSDFFEHVALTAYTESGEDKKVLFSKKSMRLSPFMANKHNFFYSGEVADLLREGKIDVGFLGSTVVDDKDLVRVARLVNANSIRHAMIIVAPKDRFKDADGKTAQWYAIKHLLTEPQQMADRCYVYYHPKSTAEKEHQELLQHAGHWHNTLPVLDLPQFQIAFADKIREHKGQIIAHIGLMLSVETAQKAVEDVGKDEFETFKFRTSEIEKVAADIGINSFKTSDFYYEMVVNRSNNKIRQLAEDKGFQLLLKLLRGSVEKLAYDRKLQGISLSHRKVAEFFDLDLQKASDLLKETEFELLFYPEWVNKVLGIL